MIRATLSTGRDVAKAQPREASVKTISPAWEIRR
jgi:hypothetical protein